MVSYSDLLVEMRYSLSVYVESYEWYPNKNFQTYNHNEELEDEDQSDKNNRRDSQHAASQMHNRK